MPSVKENGQETIPKIVMQNQLASCNLFKNSMEIYYEGKPKSDQNTFIIDIEKTIANNKIHPKYSWKINNDTYWNTYKNTIEDKIEYTSPPPQQAIIKIQIRLWTVQQ